MLPDDEFSDVTPEPESAYSAEPSAYTADPNMELFRGFPETIQAPVFVPKPKGANPYGPGPYRVTGQEWVLVADNTFFVDYGLNQQQWSAVAESAFRWDDYRLAFEWRKFLRWYQGGHRLAEAAEIVQVPARPERVAIEPITEVPESEYRVKSFRYQGITMPQAPLELKWRGPRPTRRVNKV